MIVFTKGIDLNKLRMAYNNDVIRFHSDIAVETSWAEVALRDVNGSADLFRVRLYPDPQGKFFFNLKPFITSLINTRNFEDRLETNIEAGDAASFVYDFTNGTYYNKDLFITIMHTDGQHSDGGYSLSWLAGAEQLGDYNRFLKPDIVMLTPLQKLSNNRYYLKYWQGYPFDISFYGYEKDFTVKNATNLLGKSFRIAGYVSRLFFSDGRSDETIEDMLPLVEGRNNLTFYFNQQKKYVSLEKVPYKCGVYLKWLNKYGGYSYWLFENTYSIDRATKYTGELDRDNDNLEDTRARIIPIGKESQDTIKVVAELLTEEERRIVEGLLDSPKIYLFTGQPHARNSYRDWMEVTLKTTSARIRNPKQPLTNFVFDLELPQRYMQTL